MLKGPQVIFKSQIFCWLWLEETSVSHLGLTSADLEVGSLYLKPKEQTLDLFSIIYHGSKLIAIPFYISY